jgi:hypothetical protein
MIFSEGRTRREPAMTDRNDSQVFKGELLTAPSLTNLIAGASRLEEPAPTNPPSGLFGF